MLPHNGSFFVFSDVMSHFSDVEHNFSDVFLEKYDLSICFPFKPNQKKRQPSSHRFPLEFHLNPLFPVFTTGRT